MIQIKTKIQIRRKIQNRRRNFINKGKVLFKFFFNLHR
jgi:hypothetical protein